MDWYKVEQLPWPADWSGLFGRSAPLVMEIGFGSGLFLANMARRSPADNFVGVEISVPSLKNATRKIRRAGLDNVILIQAGAAAVLQALCEPESVACVVINFPDPWPKKDQLDRRLISDDFLDLLATRMKPGASLDVATDHDDYAAHITACLMRSSCFESRISTPFVFEDEGRVETKYEQLARRDGRAPRYFKWRRNERPTQRRFPVPEELTMPHVVLRLPSDPAEIGRRFQPYVAEMGATHIRFVEAYSSLRDGKLLIDCYINEGVIAQRLGIELRARASDEIVLSLAEIGFPRPTRGVHYAIAALVDRLRVEFPSLVVVQTNLRGDHADIPQ